VPAVLVAVLKKVMDDSAGNSAALIAYYGFLSLLPLLLAGVAILGFIAQSDASARDAILDSGIGSIPIIGASLKNGHLTGSGVALSVGTVGALWAGLRVTVALQNAFDQINGVPHRRRPNFFLAQARAARLLLAIGVLELVATALTGLISTRVSGTGLVIAGIVVSLAFNGLLFAVAFRLLSDARVATRELWPGVIFATAGWELLQAAGGLYVAHVLHAASATYGSFAGVIGLLAWLYVGGRIVVYAAELNVVLARRYWPRSIIGPPTDADRAVQIALARIQERSAGESIDVRF
jgi:YihY family inner membrane protein